MPLESTQHRLSRDRAPRVQITYDVERGDSQEQKELPFVLGVMGDFAGSAGASLPPLKARKFTGIDRDSFDEVLSGMTPSLRLEVPNRLQGEGGELQLELVFRSLEDFDPGRLALQVPPLRQLLETRTRLSDLRNKMVGNARLEGLLEDMIQRTPQLALEASPGVQP